MATVTATLWQLVQTVPYVIGTTILVLALLQYMAGGENLPWDRRFRLFFAIGILADQREIEAVGGKCTLGALAEIIRADAADELALAEAAERGEEA